MSPDAYLTLIDWGSSQKLSGPTTCRVKFSSVPVTTHLLKKTKNHMRVLIVFIVVIMTMTVACSTPEPSESAPDPTSEPIIMLGRSPSLSTTPDSLPTQVRDYRFGPASGSIQISPDDGLIDGHDSNIRISNGIIEAMLDNPYSLAEGDWSNGFMFRSRTSPSIQQFHTVFVHTDGYWYHYLRTSPDADDQLMASGFSDAIVTSETGRNHVRVIFAEVQGWLFINGIFVTQLDLSSGPEFGDVSAITTYFEYEGVSGAITEFEDFVIRDLGLAYGPRDATLVHDPSDYFGEAHESTVSINDGIIEARFLNPYPASDGQYSYGFSFRSSEHGGVHRVAIDESGDWVHGVIHGDGAWLNIAMGSSSSIATGATESNHIQLIVLGADGWLFNNGHLISHLDLAGADGVIPVSAEINTFDGHGITGHSTRFEGFTIWSADGR